MSPRPVNHQARDALLDASRTEFARAGLDRTRVEDIARRAGVSKGAFYLHFDSKEHAFREILQRFLGALEEELRRRREADAAFLGELGCPTAAALEQVIAHDCRADRELLEVLWRNRLILAALDHTAASPDLEIVADFRRRMRLLLAEDVVLKQRQGWLRRDVAPDVVGDVIVGAFESYGRRMHQLRAKPDLGVWARSMNALFYEGMVDPAHRPAALRPPPRK
ncbi:MAG TPA: helix-turn-helix domain-containing protein [Anaeromyxobacteraceae bacterium]|nr:helix-turn-helix domain-containing protein [Anaeromyxobacteraceae bacterium]